ncbi:hypothetical protein B0T09DRAFT_107414 [Sordaria sp. MPI-SDFR-AT-0083]|nr:hypothetical protein B0T09DRAFT_107414 [Sordaria sp. MPI-SDFR-AT-0083]
MILPVPILLLLLFRRTFLRTPQHDLGKVRRGEREKKKGGVGELYPLFPTEAIEIRYAMGTPGKAETSRRLSVYRWRSLTERGSYSDIHASLDPIERGEATGKRKPVRNS